MSFFKVPTVLFLLVLVVLALGYIQNNDVKMNIDTYNISVDDSIYEINENLGPNEINMPIVSEVVDDKLSADEVNFPTPNESETVLGEDEVIFP